MNNRIQSIPIDKLVAHPDSPNRMGKGRFARLVRNIERTGRYEPLVVRPCPNKDCHSCAGRNPDHSERPRTQCFQIIHGHHRFRALAELSYEFAEAIVWDIDDQEADILLVTINRLAGSDVLDKKLAVLGRLDRRMSTVELAKLLPMSRTQIERLTKIGTDHPSVVEVAGAEFASPLVFFVSDEQKEIIEGALSSVCHRLGGKTRAEKNAAALASIAECFNLKSQSGV